MKTRVVVLDEDENILSIHDKMDGELSIFDGGGDCSRAVLTTSWFPIELGDHPVYSPEGTISVAEADVTGLPTPREHLPPFDSVAGEIVGQLDVLVDGSPVGDFSAIHCSSLDWSVGQ